MMLERGIRQLLAESAQQALETMFFCAPDRVAADAGRPPGELIATSLTFQGSPGGRFAAFIPTCVADSLATDFLGIESPQDLDPRQVEEIAAELSNMICGGVLSELETHSRFDISTPRSVRVAAGEPAPHFSSLIPIACRLEMSAGPMVLFLAFEESV